MISEPNFKRAVKAAYRMRQEFNTGLRFDPFLPISVEKNLVVCKYSTFCRMHDIDIRDLLRTCSTDGFTFRSGRRYIILYNDSSVIGEPRRRFTLAHELGHYALGHLGDSEPEEQEADTFARNLLAPRLIAINNGIEFPNYPQAFGISAAAARMCERCQTMDETLAVGLYPFTSTKQFFTLRLG